MVRHHVSRLAEISYKKRSCLMRRYSLNDKDIFAWMRSLFHLTAFKYIKQS